MAIVIAACGSSDESERLGQSQSALNGGQPLVIRQIYPRPGTYSRAFVEIYNRGTTPVSLSGLSLQAPQESGSYSVWALITQLPSVTLQPGQSYLTASGPLTTAPELPVVPDRVHDNPPWNRSAGGLTTPGSRVALVSGGGDLVAGTLLLKCFTARPCTIDPADAARIVDLVGFGTGKPPTGWPNSSLPAEGTPAPYPSSTQALLRKGNGAQDTDSNLDDFVLGAPQPRNMDSYVAPLPIPGVPAIDVTTGTTPGGLNSFVYDSTNPNAPQTGVTPGAIDPALAGWVVGYVKDGNGVANAGVTVSVVGQGQYGQATTRADGRFDLVVNGSANFTLRFAKTGFFSADRRVYVGAQLTASVDDVWLVAADSNAKVVTASSATFQIASGSLVAADGDSTSRTAVLMIPPQTKFRKGSTDLNSMTLRLTEYTAGPNGINRMPASLTGSPAYTYAVEISADEAPGQSVDFVQNVAGNPSQRAFFYVNDLVGFPVGSAVPTGYYDRAQAAWIPSMPSGTVVQVVVTNGVATVDVNGGGVDSPSVVAAFGITPEELAALATQYGKAGQTTTTTLWRVPITHMTPYDCNWPTVPPPCEGVCPAPPPPPPPPSSPKCTGKCCGGGGGSGDADGDSPRTGSIIGCDSGILGETVDVAGTPYSLNYSSYNAPGYAAKRQIKIALTEGSVVHSAEKAISVDVMIAGQLHHREFTPAPNLSWTFEWDGLDAAGRPVVGTAIASVKVRSVFLSKYALVAGFGDLPPDAAPLKSSPRAFVSYDRNFQAPLMGRVPAGGWALGDWTLSPHHFYDVLGNAVQLGSGGRIPSALQTSVISRIMGDGQSSAFAPDGTSANAPNYGFDISNHPDGTGAVVAAPNGDVFMVDKSRNRVRRIDSAGKIYTVAGSGTPACQQNVSTAPNFANSTPEQIATGTADATLANVTEPSSLAVGPDGSLYIGTTWERTVRKATPIGNGKYSISNFAGGSAQCNATIASTADNQPATSATFKSITALAVGPDGSVYVADGDAYRVRRIDTTGMISTIAGNGNSGGPARADEGKLASGVSINAISDIAVGPDGTLYIAQPYNLLSIDKNGKLHFLNQAFNVATTLADGVLLSTQSIDIKLESVAVTPSGAVIFNDDEWQRIHPSGYNSRAWLRTVEPSGIVTGLASTPDVPNSTAQTTPASGLALGNAPARARGLAAAPNGDVLVMTSNSIYRISPARLPDTTSCADQSVRYLVPSGDSGFCFDGNGRHKKTIDLHTGQALYTFGYSADGVLSTIKDPGGRTTNIVPTATGFVISAPTPGDVNQKTTVTVVNGHATNIADAIGSFKPSAAANGLLYQLVDGENNSFSFTYDADGYLSTDTSPLGTQKLSRTLITGGKTVTLTSPLGRKTVFETVLDSKNVLTHKTTFPDLTTETKIKTPGGSDQLIDRDGTITETKTAIVSQLNGQIALPATTTVKLPSGLVMTNLRTLTDPPSGPRVAKVMYDTTASPPTETTTTTFSSTGKTIVITSPQNRTTTIKTDGTGHVTRRQVGTLTPTDFTYISGQLATATQGARSRTFTYGTSSTDVDAGYLRQIQGPTNTTEIRRNLRGRPLSIEAGLGTTVAAKTGYTWFNTDLLKTVTTPELSADHTFSYNAAKQILQYLPPAVSGVTAPDTNYTYTDDRELLTEQAPLLSAITRAYLATSGQLDTITLPATSLSTLAGTIDYDYFNTNDVSIGAAAGRVSMISGPTAGDVLTYKYDGSLTTSQKWTGNLSAEVQWLYNNRLLPKQEKFISTTSSFDRFFGYDKDGLLVCNSPTTCNPAGTDALKITRSAIHGGVTLIDQGGASGALETWTYSDTTADQTATPKPMAYGELREQSATVGGTAASNVVADLVYDAAGSGIVSERRDNLGRIRFKTETFRDATAPHASVTKKFEYVYDERGQLKTVYRDGALIYDVAYDKNGNIKQYTTAQGGIVNYCTVDAQDRLKQCDRLAAFTYYGNGEVKTKQNAQGNFLYHHDALGRLRQVDFKGITFEFVLDGQGRRIAKKKNGSITKRWVYGAGLSPIAEFDGAGTLVARYIYGSRKNTPDLVLRDGKTYRLISDQLGSPRYAVNVADKDEVKYQVSYSPLGLPTVTGGLAPSTIDWIPFGFAGGLYDSDIGLVHFSAREYDPEVGRWVSKDPSRFRGGHNLYVYSWNDPINFVDRTGHEPTGAGGASNAGEGGGEGASSVPQGTPTVPGYTDFNVTAGAFVGVTGGYFAGADGEGHWYFGGGLTTPGVCISQSDALTGSPSPGKWSWQGAVSGFGMSASTGADSDGGGFSENGTAFPPAPGASLMGYYTW